MPKRASRRTFLKISAAAASLTAAELAHAAPTAAGVNVILDSNSPHVTSECVKWATDKLRSALKAKGVGLTATNPSLTILVGSIQISGDEIFTDLHDFNSPDAMALIPVPTPAGQPRILATGGDTRGIVYAILELADRIRLSDSPSTALHLAAPIIETTPNKVRSCARAFVSEIEDKPWFYDRAFWTSYLDTLAAARFNRFNFALGFGWDFPRGVTGDYLHFPYPYLVELPNYPGVHVEPALGPGERQRNLETLQFIAVETARRGLDFQLGIWTHAYQWTDSPHSDHHIAGLTPETHAAYCRDALAALLKACPQITGLTLRIHGESGIPEGSYPFWTTLFEAISGAGRKIEIDMHAKGLNQEMIDIAHHTGMPVKAGAKFWAEHLGLGYHQADIRAAEYPRAGVTGTFAVSSGARNFTRYGYGDFYQQNSGVDLLYRVWPGTQRHLLWGDPALAAGYGRAANFCGAAGMELCEPLTFKGREGSGRPGGRNAYADHTLGAPRLDSETWDKQPPHPADDTVILSEAKNPRISSAPPSPSDLDTEKFTLTYLLWGRYLYNPDTAPDFHHRYLKQAFGPAGPALEVALAASSRILPLVTTAWCPSASNHEYWPEMLTPVSILPYTTKPLYGDSPAPHNVSAISPLDPQLFTTIAQHADNLVSGKADARYNTSEVIAWLDGMVATSTAGLEAARKAAGTKASTPEFRRAEEDILILNGLGTYYANLFRAALAYSVAEQDPKSSAVGLCVDAYKKSRDAWYLMSQCAQNVYESDISYGSTPFRRGHWVDRLPAIDANAKDLDAYMILHYQEMLGTLASDGKKAPVQQAAATPYQAPPFHPRLSISAKHEIPAAFHPNTALTLTVTTPPTVTSAILWYRHVNQGERWLSTPMQAAGATSSAAIPAAYTASPYPLQYYFELRTATAATLHPAFNPTLSNQPYFAIHKRT
jgi:hypothetical protein